MASSNDMWILSRWVSMCSVLHPHRLKEDINGKTEDPTTKPGKTMVNPSCFSNS